MSITREAAAALADLHAANPTTRDVAGTWQEDAVAYVAALWDAEVGRAAKEGTFLPAFASHTAGMRRLIAAVVAAAREDLAEAERAQHGALAAVLNRVEFQAARAAIGELPDDVAAWQTTEHHALITTITRELEDHA